MTRFAIHEVSGGFVFEVDGMKSNEYMPYETREQAEDFMFTPYAWPGGDDVVYVGDGYILCAKCALAAWQDEGNADHDAIHNGEIVRTVWHVSTEDSGGVACDGCNEYIIEPHCADCGDLVDDVDIAFYHDTYNVIMCDSCLIDQHHRGNVRKVGYQAYEVHGGGSTDGTYSTGRQPTFSGHDLAKG